jgi:hypothetical protein
MLTARQLYGRRRQRRRDSVTRRDGEPRCRRFENLRVKDNALPLRRFKNAEVTEAPHVRLYFEDPAIGYDFAVAAREVCRYDSS